MLVCFVKVGLVGEMDSSLWAIKCEVKFPLESRILLAIESRAFWACTLVVSFVVGPFQLVNILSLFVLRRGKPGEQWLGNGCTVPDLAVSHSTL